MEKPRWKASAPAASSDAAAVRQALSEHVVPVLVDPDGAYRAELAPAVVVDAIMAKHNTGTAIDDAPLVIALGPGFMAGVDCHVVIETNRGHRLGRPIYRGAAEPDTGRPGEVGGKTAERILRAPITGVVTGRAAIGDRVAEGQVVAGVGGCDVYAGAAGVLRGMVRDGTVVSVGTKIGDVDPRAAVSHCFEISEKSLAIAGGVLEAILSAESRRSTREAK